MLIQHFSSNMTKTCTESGVLKLSAKDQKKIDAVNKSPFPRSNEKRRTSRGGALYETRPDGVPKPQSEFSLDYDFNKYDVHYLSDVFGKYGWEMNDIITQWVRTFDADIESMYDDGGRDRSFGRQYTRGISSHYHTYGQQLGWNALFLAAGQLLAECHVTDDSYDDDPWPYVVISWGWGLLIIEHLSCAVMLKSLG